MVGLKFYYKTPRGRKIIDTVCLKVPILGAIFLKIAVARFSRTLSTLLSSGVPILQSLDITARTAGQVRAQLSLTLEGILCQSLLPRADGTGRAMAMEILIPNSAIRNLIREDKVHQIYSMMQTGQDIHGMQTFNQSLATLFHKRSISKDMAFQASSNSNELRDLIDRGAGLNTGNGSMRPPVPGGYNAQRPAQRR